MIESISSAAPPITADPAAKAPGTKTLRHTPFGDVMVDELSTPDLLAAFGGKTTVAPAEASPASAAQSDPRFVPTAQSVFGERVWEDSPSGEAPSLKGSSEPFRFPYNPIYFATRQTAEKIAEMVGGKVVEENWMAPHGPMSQSVPNQMIELPGGRRVIAGLIADFYNHGYPQSYIDRLLNVEIQGA